MKSTTKSHPSISSALEAVRDRRGHLSNIYIFQSPKNNRRFIIKGDIAFMVAVLLEGDRTVARYLVDPPAVQTVIDGETRATQLDFTVWFQDGHEEWWECKRKSDTGPGRTGRAGPQLSAQAQAAQAAGIFYRILTEDDVLPKAFLFDNWLTLCSAINRAKGQPSQHEAAQLRQALAMHGTVTLKTLMTWDGTDPAVMLGLVGRLLQQGLLDCALETRLLGTDSLIVGSAP